MADSELVAEIRSILETPREDFRTRVADEAEALKAAVDDGTFDNSEGLAGLEYEFYAVRGQDPTTTGGTHRTRGAGTLCRVPRRTLSFTGFEKELGLHNAEMRTSPQPHNQYGLAAQGDEVRGRLAMVRRAVLPHDIHLVSDGLWTIPPVGESANEYLLDAVEIDGITLAANMSESARYHAMANTSYDIGMRVDAPHVSLQAETIMPESLITSIQPHYQVPRAAELPEFFRYAIRIAGPLLALGVNSPLFPPDLYDDGADPRSVLDDAHHEHRIGVFESVLNGDEVQKVRFPRDIASTDEAIDRIAADETFVPQLLDPTGRFDDRFRHLRHKHGTYWRWVRPVFDGHTEASANARIEFRPLPGQPTVRDSIALQAAFTGALVGLYARQHPVRELPWSVAEQNFYAAMRDGLEAELTWITADGLRTTAPDELFKDLFDHVETGLREQLLPDEHVDAYIEPLRHRVRGVRTPASWKLDIASDCVEQGASLEEAIETAQRAYLEQQRGTLLEGSFEAWPQASAVSPT